MSDLSLPVDAWQLPGPDEPNTARESWVSQLEAQVQRLHALARTEEELRLSATAASVEAWSARMCACLARFGEIHESSRPFLAAARALSDLQALRAGCALTRIASVWCRAGAEAQAALASCPGMAACIAAMKSVHFLREGGEVWEAQVPRWFIGAAGLLCNVCAGCPAAASQLLTPETCGSVLAALSWALAAGNPTICVRAVASLHTMLVAIKPEQPAGLQVILDAPGLWHAVLTACAPVPGAEPNHDLIDLVTWLAEHAMQAGLVAAAYQAASGGAAASTMQQPSEVPADSEVPAGVEEEEEAGAASAAAAADTRAQYSKAVATPEQVVLMAAVEACVSDAYTQRAEPPFLRPSDLIALTRVLPSAAAPEAPTAAAAATASPSASANAVAVTACAAPEQEAWLAMARAAAGHGWRAVALAVAGEQRAVQSMPDAHMLHGMRGVSTDSTRALLADNFAATAAAELQRISEAMVPTGGEGASRMRCTIPLPSGYKTSWLQLLANLAAAEGEGAAAALLDSGTLRAVLESTRLDPDSPLAREWALIIVKSCIASSARARDWLGELTIQGVQQSPDLRNLGMRVVVDEATGKPSVTMQGVRDA